jgi:lipoic acid synthetase/lipoate-protein ligase A
MQMKNDIIKGINILGDYFLTGDLNGLLARLKDVRMDTESLRDALPDSTDDIIQGLQKEDLITLIMK